MGNVWAKFPEVHYMSTGLGDSGEVGEGGESGRGNVAQKLNNVQLWATSPTSPVDPAEAPAV